MALAFHASMDMLHQKPGIENLYRVKFRQNTGSYPQG